MHQTDTAMMLVTEVRSIVLAGYSGKKPGWVFTGGYVPPMLGIF